MLFQDLNINHAVSAPYLNTRSPMDIAVGRYERGIDDKWILNGGIPPMMGIVGRAQTFKSTVADSIIAGAMLCYPTIETVKLDSENNSFGLERFDHMAGQIVRESIITDRIRLINSISHPMEPFVQFVQQVGEYKVKHKKDYWVESPFKDPNSDGPLMIWIPTIVDVDSLTLYRTGIEGDLFNKVAIEDSKHNTIDMTDGKMKTRMIRQFAQYALKFGIYFIFTAHVDDVIDIDPYNPTPKQLQWLKNKDRIKGVGSQFEFLTNVLLQVSSPKPIVDSNKLCEYPHGDHSTPTEICELPTTVVRCKTNSSGTTVPLVLSQNLGVMSGLSNYHYLKNNEDFGFTVKGHNRYPITIPDLCLTRKNIREKLEGNYELQRSLEILAQMKFIATNWSPSKLTFDLPQTAEMFVEKVTACKDMQMSDILNSRGYWTWDKSDKREFLSTFDILEKLTNR